MLVFTTMGFSPCMNNGLKMNGRRNKANVQTPENCKRWQFIRFSIRECKLPQYTRYILLAEKRTCGLTAALCQIPAQYMRREATPGNNCNDASLKATKAPGNTRAKNKAIYSICTPSLHQEGIGCTINHSEIDSLQKELSFPISTNNWIGQVSNSYKINCVCLSEDYNIPICI